MSSLFDLHPNFHHKAHYSEEYKHSEQNWNIAVLTKTYFLDFISYIVYCNIYYNWEDTVGIKFITQRRQHNVPQATVASWRSFPSRNITAPPLYFLIPGIPVKCMLVALALASLRLRSMWQIKMWDAYLVPVNYWIPTSFLKLYK